jgi:hypothetical protein
MDTAKITGRIKQLVDNYADGNVAKFAKDIGLSQQKVNRIFNIDTRTGKYPTATTDMLWAIAERYVNISPEWLLTGNGPMLKKISEKDLIHQSIIGDNNQMAGKKITNSNDERDLKSTINELRKQMTDKDHIISALIKQQEMLLSQISKLTDKITQL